MENQYTRIKNAKTAYILTLNDACTRFQVYLIENDKLETLWPVNSHLEKKADLLQRQIFSNHTRFPAYHFYIPEWGTDRYFILAKVLKEINTDIEVFALNGVSPSKIIVSLND